MIEEENLTWSVMIEDYNSVDKFKSDVVAHLNEYENMWCSHHPNYKPFISHGHNDSTNEELDSLNELNIQEDPQIADQYPLNQSIKII